MNVAGPEVLGVGVNVMVVAGQGHGAADRPAHAGDGQRAAVDVGVVGQQSSGGITALVSSAVVMPVSSTAIGGSLTAVTVTVTVAVSVPPLPSETV